MSLVMLQLAPWYLSIFFLTIPMLGLAVDVVNLPEDDIVLGIHMKSSAGMTAVVDVDARTAIDSSGTKL